MNPDAPAENLCTTSFEIEYSKCTKGGKNLNFDFVS